MNSKCGHYEKAEMKNQGNCGLWWCLLLNLMMPKWCPKRLNIVKHHERPNMLKPKQLWSLMMPDFRSQDVRMMPEILVKSGQHKRLERSKLEIYNHSWCLVLDLKMPKIMPKKSNKHLRRWEKPSWHQIYLVMKYFGTNAAKMMPQITLRYENTLHTWWAIGIWSRIVIYRVIQLCCA